MQQPLDAIPIADRSYIRIQPTETSLTPETVESHFQRLHQLKNDTVDTSWYNRFLPTTSPPPTVEWLLTTDGNPDSTLDYYVGIDDPDLGDDLTEICRGLFPNDYEFERIDWHPARALVPSTVLTELDPDQEPANTSLTTQLDSYAAVSFRGCAERRRDWQMRLQPFETFMGQQVRLPLAAVIETLAESQLPMAYQVLLQSHPDWTAEAEKRTIDLQEGWDTPGTQLANWVFGTTFGDEYREPDERTYATGVRERLNELDAKDSRRSFTLTARAVATATTETLPTPESQLTGLTTAFEPVSQDYYQIDSELLTDDDATDVVENFFDRTIVTRNYDRLYTKLPLTSNRSRGIIGDHTEAPNFCMLDGTALTATGDRALATTPGERTPLQCPPDDILTTYRGEGLTLGRPLDQDNTVDDSPIALPPDLQPLHVAWFGKTGAGKSTSLINAILDNQTATDGADILIDPKGDGMATSYLRAHYAEYGTLDDVYYFDCSETLPALSFFDIRPQLADGIDRTSAVEDVIDHYIEILTGIMGQRRFEQAVRSPDIIRYLLKALFDPVHGTDAFSHREFQQLTADFHNTQDSPPVADQDLQLMLDGIAANTERSFDELMQGVANRIEKVPLNARLGQLFNHVPADYENDPYFDLRSVLDEDAVVIFDTGGLRADSRRTFTLVLLSTLWTALQRRTRQQDEAELPLVNLYLEEAADLAGSELLDELLEQSRSFGLSMTLAMQFPEQLTDTESKTYRELLNNVSTVITSGLVADSLLAKRFATDEFSPADVCNRLGSLARGEWLVDLPAAFADPEPQPFAVESMPLPPGHRDSPTAFSKQRQTAFKSQFQLVRTRTRREHGLAIEAAGSGSTPDTLAMDTGPSTSALPYTERLPEPVTYDIDDHMLTCLLCERQYDPTLAGMQNAISCCHGMSNVDRDAIPICNLPLKLTTHEQRRSKYTPAQLRFLKAVYAAHRGRFDSELEYDILRDSMRRLEEYTGVDDVQQLIHDELLRVDCTHPHKLYTVTPTGRDVIEEQHSEGVAYGDGKGDLSESSMHVMMVKLGRRYIEQEYVDNPDSAVTDAAVYYELTERDHRLDAVGLDDEGNIVVTLEAERVNNDVRRAAVSDYDKMAACDPVDAIWIVENREGAHDVLDALNNPTVEDGDPRVNNTYSRQSPPQTFQIDRPGFTKMRTVETVQRKVLGES